MPLVHLCICVKKKRWEVCSRECNKKDTSGGSWYNMAEVKPFQSVTVLVDSEIIRTILSRIRLKHSVKLRVHLR